jgi:hypothetical protein
VANDETPLWVPPVFVPIDKAAIDARQGALWHMKTNGTDERSLCHLTVLVMISCPEWREIAFQALQYVGDDRQVVVLVLPPSHRGEPLPLHPAAEEFALAFTRDVLSQQIGAYVDFCIMPSTLLDFGELNLAMNKVRAVSTGLALHYVEQVLSDLRAKAHERLVAIQNAKKGTDDYKRRTALRVELTSLDAAPLSHCRAFARMRRLDRQGRVAIGARSALQCDLAAHGNADRIGAVVRAVARTFALGCILERKRAFGARARAGLRALWRRR